MQVRYQLRQRPRSPRPYHWANFDRVPVAGEEVVRRRTIGP